MAKAADQFRSSDVTVWGIIALGCWAVAVLGANLSALVPSSIYAALHASRLDGSTMNQLRTQVGALEEESSRMRRENDQLLQRFAMNEETATATSKRLGALEISLPKIIEAQSATGTAIDNSVTGSIGDGQTLTFEVEGGSVAVRQRPLLPGSDEVKYEAVQLPAALPEVVADGSKMGIAIGFPVQADEAEAQWQEMLAKVGTILIGLGPVLGEADGSTGKLLIAGPVLDKASAIELCGRLDQVGIPCEPHAYAGEAVPLLN